MRCCAPLPVRAVGVEPGGYGTRMLPLYNQFMAGEPRPALIHSLNDDEPPPVLGTWIRLYGAIVAYLALLITLFYLFSVTFTPR